MRKSVTPVQITHRNFGLWLVERQGNFLSQWYHVKWWQNVWKNSNKFFSSEKIKSRKVYSGHWRYNRRTAKWCKKNTNTAKSTSFWLSMWKVWCKGKRISLEIEEYETAELNRLLEKFCAEVKNKYNLPALPPRHFFSFLYY